MPLKSILMAFALSAWLIASVIAFMVVAYTTFFGIGVIGLMIWFVSTRVEMEGEGGVAGSGLSPGFLAQQVQAREGMSRAERAAFHGRRLLESQSTRFFTYLGIALTVIGFGGFLLFQLDA